MCFEIIKKIFNKNVELNLINLKYFYFNSDIFSQPLVLKLRNKRNLLRYLKACVRKVKIKKTNEIINTYFFDLNKLSKVKTVDILNKLLLNLLKQNEKNYTNNTVEKNKYGFNILKYIILNNIKYKRVSGVRL